jgi:hypothetical protein
VLLSVIADVTNVTAGNAVAGVVYLAIFEPEFPTKSPPFRIWSRRETD